LGIGNLLLSDEGVGIHVLSALEAKGLPADIDLLDGGTGGFRLISCFQDYENIVIVDAMVGGQPPGTMTVTQPRFASDFPRVLSAHDIGLRDLIESATLLGELPAMFLVAVTVAAQQPVGTELSPPVRAAVGGAVAQVQRLVESIMMTTRPGARGASAPECP
jgi:hydrogenase maturation protease